MPYVSFNGTCLDQTKVVQAFANQYPMVDQAGNYVEYTSASIVSGDISYTLRQRPISSNTFTNRTGTLNLTTCDPSETYKAQGIDNAAILEAFGWGFAAVILFWSMGYAVGVATGVVRRA